MVKPEDGKGMEPAAHWMLQVDPDISCCPAVQPLEEAGSALAVKVGTVHPEVF